MISWNKGYKLSQIESKIEKKKKYMNGKINWTQENKTLENEKKN